MTGGKPKQKKLFLPFRKNRRMKKYANQRCEWRVGGLKNYYFNNRWMWSVRDWKEKDRGDVRSQKGSERSRESW
jgi:hypothetical protein